MKVNFFSQPYVLYVGHIHYRYLTDYKIKIIGDKFVYHIIMADYCCIKETT